MKGLASKSSKAFATRAVHEIVINGLRFHVLDGGSKLVRIRGKESLSQGRISVGSHLLGPNDAANATPKKADVGGVVFLRSKNGNLYRSGIVKAKR